MHNVVPQLHVQDVLRSQAFFELLGLTCESRFGPEGDPYWARFQGDRVDIMVAKADGPVDAAAQAILFYFYVPSIAAVRELLLANGAIEGGAFTGKNPQHDPGSVLVFDATYPFYLPAGMMRVQDPDGYIWLVAQL